MVAAYLFRPACRRFAGCRLISHALVFRGGVDGYNEHQSRHLQIESRVLKTPNLVFGNRYARALYDIARWSAANLVLAYTGIVFYRGYCLPSNSASGYFTVCSSNAKRQSSTHRKPLGEPRGSDG